MVNSDPDSEISLLNKFLSQLEEKIREFLPVAHNKFETLFINTPNNNQIIPKALTKY